MNKEKQIEEMAKALTAYEKKLCDRLPKDKCLLTSAVHAQVSCDYCKIAEFLVNAGYRKASKVAREIFEEIEELLIRLADESKLLRDKEINLGEKTQLNGEWIGVRLALRDIAELKKKYESEKDNG